MNKLSTKTMNKILIFLSIIIILIDICLIIKLKELKNTENNEVREENIVTTCATDKKENVYNNSENDSKEVVEDKDSLKEKKWTLEIPEIDLNAQISEGTSKEIMDKYIGHFEETKLEYGNVGLAAHNRGYPVNYFKDLKKLKIGSEITYIHDDFEATYIVDTIEIIENTNWDYLKNSEDNRITLITCVENEPRYRRCIQGVEKEEREEY